MQLTPRYDGGSVLRFAAAIGDVSVPLLRQRRRLGALLEGFDDDQWAAPSRCAGWSTRDVVSHLTTADQFWALSMRAGLAGKPTRYLGGFDPVATPAQMVAAASAEGPPAVLAAYQAAVDGLAAVLTDLDDEQWAVLTEAPPGHLPLDAVVSHALWDGWVHERDIALPLGLTPAEEPDEVVTALRYVAGLGPAFLASIGDGRPGTLAVVGTDPDATIVVELTDVALVRDGEAPAEAVRIEGRSVDLVEGLSLRAPLPHPVADEDRWLLGGLATVFDQVV